ncbi:UV excision repair protein RAD23A [Pelomyxa schiedti]|nr:UV excision repair protein RAD23A [Pelomyxa schiedti]
MKILIKTLSKQVYELAVEPTNTVLQLKELIEKQNGTPPAHQKLIFTGKVLEDASTLSSVGVQENCFLVLMIKKPTNEATPPKATPTTAAVTPALTTAAPTPTAPNATLTPTPTPTPTPATAAPVARPPPPTALTPASAPADNILVTGSEYEATIQRICDMGFVRDEVLRALRAAFNNPDRAVEYLFNGIPETQGLPNEAPHLVPVTPAERPPVMPTAGLGMQGVPFAMFNAARGGHGRGTGGVGRGHQAWTAVDDDASEEEEDDGEGDGEEDDGEDVGEDDDVDLGPELPITAEDMAAINRLVGLGFTENKAAQAYFTCEKNEEYAANWLLEHGNDDPDDDDDDGDDDDM